MFSYVRDEIGKKKLMFQHTGNCYCMAVEVLLSLLCSVSCPNYLLDKTHIYLQL